jgi:hypothetical protein
VRSSSRRRNLHPLVRITGAGSNCSRTPVSRPIGATRGAPAHAVGNRHGCCYSQSNRIHPVTL